MHTGWMEEGGERVRVCEREMERRLVGWSVGIGLIWGNGVEF